MIARPARVIVVVGWNMKRGITVTLTTLAMAALTSCATAESVLATNAPWCVVTLRTSKPSYLPGEEVVAFLSLSNASSGNISFTREYFPMKCFTLRYSDGTDASWTEFKKWHGWGIATGQHGFRTELTAGERMEFRQPVNLIFDVTLPNTYTLSFRGGFFRRHEDSTSQIAVQTTQCVFTVEGEPLTPMKHKKGGPANQASQDTSLRADPER